MSKSSPLDPVMESMQVELLAISQELQSSVQAFDAVSAPLQTIEKAAERVGKSWSRSWLGYQSRVYYKDFEPPPPRGHFSIEWGLPDWQPSLVSIAGATRGCWHEYARDDVRKAIFRMAGEPDLAETRKAAKEAANLFDEKRNEILSILQTYVSGKRDPFADELVEKAKKCGLTTVSSYLQAKRPTELIASRDARVRNGVFEVPPHLAVLADVATLRGPRKGCADLAKIAKTAAAHLGRRDRQEREPKAAAEGFVGANENSAGTAVANPADSLSRLERLCTRFHQVSQQLRRRHAGRPAFEVADEYDVQDLMHALLWIDFDDVRTEEGTPSHAGKSSRMDFLLKREQIVLELKMTRDTLGEKDVGDQLVLDIERYTKHSDCKTLVCFVYDPDNFIPNPRGLERDLTREAPPFLVRVFVRPLR